jgi:hypothetical protein
MFLYFARASKNGNFVSQKIIKTKLAMENKEEISIKTYLKGPLRPFVLDMFLRVLMIVSMIGIYNKIENIESREAERFGDFYTFTAKLTQSLTDMQESMLAFSKSNTERSESLKNTVQGYNILLETMETRLSENEYEIRQIKKKLGIRE